MKVMPVKCAGYGRGSDEEKQAGWRGHAGVYEWRKGLGEWRACPVRDSVRLEGSHRPLMRRARQHPLTPWLLVPE